MEAFYHVAIIGSGPAGPKAAIQAAKLRKRVAIIDRPTGDLDSVFVFQRCDSFEQGHLVSVQLGENHVLFVVYDVRAAGDQILHPQIPPALDSVGLQVVKAAEIQHRFPQGLVFHQESLQLLGVHAIGQGATEIIHIGQAVLFFKGTIDYFIENTFNYPTLAECYRVAALNKVMVDE